MIRIGQLGFCVIYAHPFPGRGVLLLTRRRTDVVQGWVHFKHEYVFSKIVFSREQSGRKFEVWQTQTLQTIIKMTPASFSLSFDTLSHNAKMC